MGPLQESRGDLSGLIVSRVYARSVLTPHARQSKARLRGLFCMNSLTGPRRTEGRVCSSLPHIHASVRHCYHCRVMITHTSQSDRGTLSRVYPKHKRKKITLTRQLGFSPKMVRFIWGIIFL